MMLDTTDQELYHSGQSAAHASNDVSGGSGASVFRCGICLTQEAWEAGLCKACYHHRRRSGSDENPQTRTVRRAKRKPVIPSREEPGDDTITYAEWCESRGYDHKTRTYAQAQPAEATQAG